MPFGVRYMLRRSAEEAAEEDERSKRMREAAQSYNQKRPGMTNQPRRSEEAPVEPAPATPPLPEGGALSPEDLAAKAGAAQQVLDATSPMMMATSPVSSVPPLPANIQPGFFNPLASTPPAISGNITPAADLGYLNPRTDAKPAASALSAGLSPTAGLIPGQAAPSAGTATFAPNASLTSAPVYDPKFEGDYQNRMMGRAMSRMAAGMGSSLPAVRA